MKLSHHANSVSHVSLLSFIPSQTDLNVRQIPLNWLARQLPKPTPAVSCYVPVFFFLLVFDVCSLEQWVYASFHISERCCFSCVCVDDRKMRAGEKSWDRDKLQQLQRDTGFWARSHTYVINISFCLCIFSNMFGIKLQKKKHKTADLVKRYWTPSFISSF